MRSIRTMLCLTLLALLAAGGGSASGDTLTNVPNQEISVIMYGGAFVRDHRDVGVKFMRAYIRGVRYYNDAYPDGKLNVALLREDFAGRPNGRYVVCGGSGQRARPLPQEVMRSAEE